MVYDVVIVGGGPSGLSAALALGRARKRVLLCDAGPRRNAAAVQIHNFVTRDGTPPAEFRRIGREQLAIYPHVEVRDVRVEAIRGERGAFTVELGAQTVVARRIALCTGMIDEMLPIEGFAPLWGRSIFQCPYCHGWEARDRRWGYLVTPTTAAHMLPFALKLTAWTRDVTVFVDPQVTLADEVRAALARAGVPIAKAPIARLVGVEGQLERIELADGTHVPCDVLFAHPPQRHVGLVSALGLALDDDGYVKADPMRRETSMPGIYTSGDVSSRMQGAIFAAASGAQLAAMINMELSMERALAGESSPAAG